jgi:hypothetical protein
VHRHIGGTKEMQFQRSEIAAAKALIEKLTPDKRVSRTSSQTAVK